MMDATWRFDLSCLVLLSPVWPKRNHSHKHICFYLLSTLIVIGLHNFLGNIYIYIYIFIYTSPGGYIYHCNKIWYTKTYGEKLKQGKRGKTMQDKTRQGCTKTRKCPLARKILLCQRVRTNYISYQTQMVIGSCQDVFIIAKVNYVWPYMSYFLSCIIVCSR